MVLTKWLNETSHVMKPGGLFCHIVSNDSGFLFVTFIPAHAAQMKLLWFVENPLSTKKKVKVDTSCVIGIYTKEYQALLLLYIFPWTFKFCVRSF